MPRGGLQQDLLPARDQSRCFPREQELGSSPSCSGGGFSGLASGGAQGREVVLMLSKSRRVGLPGVVVMPAPARRPVRAGWGSFGEEEAKGGMCVVSSNPRFNLQEGPGEPAAPAVEWPGVEDVGLSPRRRGAPGGGGGSKNRFPPAPGPPESGRHKQSWLSRIPGWPFFRRSDRGGMV